jgi:general nucleoside transport system ATP-binding protein
MDPLVELRGITKRFGSIRANRDVDLQVLPGEVHALLGENGAGKTTLMKILFGLLQPDEGEIVIRGQKKAIRSPRHAAALGIGMVHQHFMLVPDMTVAENVALSQEKAGGLRLRLQQVSSRLAELCARYGLQVDPGAHVEDVSVGMRQRAEILKLLYRDAEILVLDEPTAVLTTSEWEVLKGVLRRLAGEGRAIIFISHKLQEILDVADRCTVMRDGAVVGTLPRDEMEETQLARMMVGRDIVLRVPRERRPGGEVVLELEKVSLVERAAHKALLEDISFAVREGEIFGIAGVDGNGQSELFDILTGLRRPTGGSIRLKGKEVRRLSPREFIRRNGSIVPEDRHLQGLALDMTVADNLVMSEVWDRRFVRRGMLDHGAIRKHSESLVTDYAINVPSRDAKIRHLSGGNQQKVILARCLHSSPRVLIASQPTRGLDVGAMQFVYRHLLDLKRGGSAICLISSDMEELLSLSDRMGVLVGGRFVGFMEQDEADQETLGLLMAGRSAPAHGSLGAG